MVLTEYLRTLSYIWPKRWPTKVTILDNVKRSVLTAKNKSITVFRRIKAIFYIIRTLPDKNVTFKIVYIRF